MKQQMRLSEFFQAPTAHEAWVRNRIPRGAHYDPADDGPEVEIIESIEKTELVDRLERWLHPHTWPAEGLVDALTHRRE